MACQECRTELRYLGSAINPVVVLGSYKSSELCCRRAGRCPQAVDALPLATARTDAPLAAVFRYSTPVDTLSHIDELDEVSIGAFVRDVHALGDEGLQGKAMRKLEKVVEKPSEGDHATWALAAALPLDWFEASGCAWDRLLKRCCQV